MASRSVDANSVHKRILSDHSVRRSSATGVSVTVQRQIAAPTADSAAALYKKFSYILGIVSFSKIILIIAERIKY